MRAGCGLLVSISGAAKPGSIASFPRVVNWVPPTMYPMRTAWADYDLRLQTLRDRRRPLLPAPRLRSGLPCRRRGGGPGPASRKRIPPVPAPRPRSWERPGPAATGCCRGLVMIAKAALEW